VVEVVGRGGAVVVVVGFDVTVVDELGSEVAVVLARSNVVVVADFSTPVPLVTPLTRPDTPWGLS